MQDYRELMQGLMLETKILNKPWLTSNTCYFIIISRIVPQTLIEDSLNTKWKLNACYNQDISCGAWKRE